MKKTIIQATLLLYCWYCPGQDINQSRLEEMVNRAKESHSNGLVIYQNGQLVGSWQFGNQPQLVDIKSVTKSITNLAVGYLVSQGKLDIEQPVYHYYPQWDQENKRDIKIKHLLRHNSGLLDSEFSLVENTQDIIRFALASDLSHPVGKYYVYNNKAVNLLAGIVENADGRKLDKLVAQEIFGPLGINHYKWPRDQTGNPYVMAFLQMYPEDLAKIGLLVLNQGNWNGNQIIDKAWFDQSMQPDRELTPEYGLLWELLATNFRYVIDDKQISHLSEQGVDPRIIEQVSTMKGTYGSHRDYYGKVREVFGDNFSEIFSKKLVPLEASIARKQVDGQWGFAGIGYLGQYLVIYPKYQLVAVRLINDFEGYNWETDEFTDFPQLVKSLTDD